MLYDRNKSVSQLVSQSLCLVTYQRDWNVILNIFIFSTLGMSPCRGGGAWVSLTQELLRLGLQSPVQLSRIGQGREAWLRTAPGIKMITVILILTLCMALLTQLYHCQQDCTITVCCWCCCWCCWPFSILPALLFIVEPDFGGSCKVKCLGLSTPFDHSLLKKKKSFHVRRQNIKTL